MAEIALYSHQNGARTLFLVRTGIGLHRCSHTCDLIPAPFDSWHFGVNCLQVICDVGTLTGIALIPASDICELGLKAEFHPKLPLLTPSGAMFAIFLGGGGSRCLSLTGTLPHFQETGLRQITSAGGRLPHLSPTAGPVGERSGASHMHSWHPA